MGSRNPFKRDGEEGLNKRLMICGSCSILFGIFLIIFGVSVKYIITDQVVQSQIYLNLDLKEGTETWDAWLSPPVDVYMSYKFFHVENWEAMTTDWGAQKPNLVEVGPYAFLEFRDKKNVIELNGEHLSYDSYLAFDYNEAETARLLCRNLDGEPCQRNDTFRILNPILAALPQMIPQELVLPDDGSVPIVNVNRTNEVIQQTLDQFWTDVNVALTDPTACPGCQDELFVEVAMIDLMFDGHEYGILKAVQYALEQSVSLPDDEICTVLGDFLGIIEPGGKNQGGFKNYGKPLENIGPNIPSFPGRPGDADCNIIKTLIQRRDYDPNNLPTSIGFLAGGNASIAGQHYVVNNGRYDHQKLIQFEQFNGMSELPDSWWPSVGPTPAATAAGHKGVCKALTGTDGTQFPAYLDKDIKLWVFISDMCRSLWLEYQGESKVGKIKTWDYRPPFDVYDMKNPDNYCYCPQFLDIAEPADDGSDTWNTTGLDEICKTGMIRLDSCAAGAPVIFSSPHFWYGDESLVTAIDGISPVKDLHETYLMIDPLLGVAFDAHKRIQINVGVTRIPELDLLAGVDDIVFPLLWLDEYATITEEDEKEYHKALTKPLNIVDGISIGLGIVLGSLLVLGGIVCCWFG